MRLLIQLRFTRIARLALGLALFAQFALAAAACLLPDRSVSSAPVIVSLIGEDQQFPCSDAPCLAQHPDTDICLAEVTRSDRAPGPFTITATPDIASLPFYRIAPHNTAAPIATPRPSMVIGSAGSHLSILYCSFQT